MEESQHSCRCCRCVRQGEYSWYELGCVRARCSEAKTVLKVAGSGRACDAQARGQLEGWIGAWLTRGLISLSWSLEKECWRSGLLIYMPIIGGKGDWIIEAGATVASHALAS